MRLGKKERAKRAALLNSQRELIANVRHDVAAQIKANRNNLDAIREHARLNRVASSANRDRLLGATHTGYADDLHARRSSN